MDGRREVWMDGGRDRRMGILFYSLKVKIALHVVNV